MKRFFRAFYLMMLAIISLCFASCSSDDNSTSDSRSGRESNSPLIGIWVNEISSENFYALVFCGDGTGFYVEEPSNSLSFSYRTFKFTTIPYESTTERNTDNGEKTGTSTQNSTKNGSVEIAFDDGGKSVNSYIGGTYDIGAGGTGEYVVTSNGQLQLTNITGIEKSIFTTTTKNLYARPNIEGYWTNETNSMNSSDKIVMMEVNKDNSGNITVLNENTHPMDYSNSVYEFSSFDVFNDILILHLTSNTTKKIRIKRITNSGTESLQVSLAAIPLYKSEKPSNLEPNLLVGQWIGYTGEYSSDVVYLRVLEDNKMFAYSFNIYDNHLIQEGIAGKYSLSGRMLKVLEDIVVGDGEVNTREVSFYIKDLGTGTMNVYTSIDRFSYGMMKRIEMTKKKADVLESQLIGTWEVTGYWPYADYRPKSFVFSNDGSYSMVDYNNDLTKGYFMVKDSQLYLFGNGDLCNVRIEGDMLYIDNYTYTRK